jgi:iron complex outermembrane recepter protein
VRNEPYAFERIEILRGPSSVMAGQNGPGGVVNLVSKRPQSDAQREITVQAGSYDHKLLAVDFTGPVNEDGSVLYRLVGVAKDSGTQIEHADDERQYVAPSITWRPNTATTITAYAQYQKDRSGNTNGFFPIEGLRYPGPHGFIPSDTFIGEPDWDTYGGRRVRVGYQFEYEFNDQWSIRHDLRHDDVDGKLRTMYAAWWDGYQGPDQRSLNRLWYAANDRSRITNADLFAVGKLQTGRVEHTLLLGMDGMWSSNSSKSVEGAATPLDVYHPVYGTFPLPPLIFDPTQKTDVRQVGFIVQDQIKIDKRWVVVPSLRRDYAKTEVKDAPDAGSDDAAWSSRLGVVYLADGGWSPYVNYSESFEAVTGGAYKPKRGKQFEAGVKWLPLDQLSVTAAAYRLQEKNRLTAGPNPVGPSVQRGEVTVKGFELEAIAGLVHWDIIGNYTYTDAKVTSSGDPFDRQLNNQLAGIPKHAASVWTVYKFSAFDIPGFRAGVGVRYVGETDDGIEVTTTPSNTLVDALLSFDRDQWQYALNASNLFDKDYVATCLDRGDCWLGSRRKVIGSVSYRF